MVNALTIDVEEYFHPEEVRSSTAMDRWSSMPSRVEGQMDRVLELLDQYSVRATFFVLGWVADHHPRVVRKILAAGHEIGCHSYAHQLVYTQTRAQFRHDITRAVIAIEDAGGVTPRSYRAPSYSVIQESLWALEVLAEKGFHYDSSIFPVIHDRYGIPGFTRHPKVVETPSGPITEIPGATVEVIAGSFLPVGGGGYLRLLPYRYTAAGIRRINQRENRPACIYFHPWELDVHQPRIAAGVIASARTYWGLEGMEKKLRRLLTDFRFSTLGSVYPAACVTRPACAVSKYDVDQELRTPTGFPGRSIR